MTLVDRKTLTRARRTNGDAHRHRQPAPKNGELEEAAARDLEGARARVAVAVPAAHPETQARPAARAEPVPTGDNGVAPSKPQRPAAPITKQAPISKPEVAGKTGQPPPESEPRTFGLLVLVGAIFGLAVVKECLGRIRGPVVVTVKSAPRLPGPFWTMAVVVGTLGRIGARVLGLRGA